MPPAPVPWTRAAALKRVGPIAIALAVLMLVTHEIGLHAVQRVTAQREAALDAQFAVGRARRNLLLMESALRGYMLTARPEYLQPYQGARKDVGTALEAIRRLSDRDEGQRAVLVKVATAASSKMSELDEVLRLFSKGDSSLAMELMLTDIGREQMDRVNELTAQVIRDAERAYAEGGVLRDRVRLWSRIALATMVLLCLVAVRLAMRLSQGLAQERARHLADLASERDKLEAEVSRRTEELRDLARHLQTVREDERSRLARELHDELGGLLTAAKLDVARIRKRVADGPPETLERLSHLGQTLDAGIALKRRIIEDLRPSALANLGLQQTLEILCSEFSRRAELPVQAELEPVQLSDERALAVYRLVQEALTNVAKYARARQVRVGLHRQGERVAVSVEDDGVGFDPAQVRAGTHGLAGMRFRVESCGGHWSLRSAPGQGTSLRASLPL